MRFFSIIMLNFFRFITFLAYFPKKIIGFLTNIQTFLTFKSKLGAKNRSFILPLNLSLKKQGNFGLLQCLLQLRQRFIILQYSFLSETTIGLKKYSLFICTLFKNIRVLIQFKYLNFVA